MILTTRRFLECSSVSLQQPSTVKKQLYWKIAFKMDALSLEPRNCILSNQYQGIVLKCEHLHLALQHNKSVNHGVFCPFRKKCRSNQSLHNSRIWWVLVAWMCCKNEARKSTCEGQFLTYTWPCSIILFSRKGRHLWNWCCWCLEVCCPTDHHRENIYPLKKRLTCSQQKT